MPTFTIGLLSDTHIPHRLKWMPDAVLDALTGVDLVMHAGDVDDPAALEPLRTLAPVHAVRGNIHIQDLSDGGAMLPAVVKLEFAGQRIVMTHGHRPGPLGFCLKSLDVITQHLGLTNNAIFNRRIARRLARLYPEADIIIFGHTHRAHVERVGHPLLVNPGAVCVSPREQPSVARIRLSAGRPEVEVCPLAGITRDMRQSLRSHRHGSSQVLSRADQTLHTAHGGER
jgi:putative phosphoesterase